MSPQTKVFVRMALAPPIATAVLPQTYERAKVALTTCVSIDECKAWADKAAALASYAKQADDQSLHQLATRISARAIRRAGELLQEFQNPGTRTDLQLGGGTPTKLLTQRQAAEQAGMSKDQEVQAVRVARVPIETFDGLVESEQPPTITTLAELGTSTNPAKVAPPPGFADATMAIEAVCEFAAFCLRHPARSFAGGINGNVVASIGGDVAVVTAWLEEFNAYLNPY
jgi:hypothetical protein